MYYINALKQEPGTANKNERNWLTERYVVDRHWCHIAAMFGLFFDED